MKSQFFTPATHKHVHLALLGIQLWGDVLANIFSCIQILLKIPFVQYFQFIDCSWPAKKQRKRGVLLLLYTWTLFGVIRIVQVVTTIYTVLKIFKIVYYVLLKLASAAKDKIS